MIARQDGDHVSQFSRHHLQLLRSNKVPEVVHRETALEHKAPRHCVSTGHSRPAQELHRRSQKNLTSKEDGLLGGEAMMSARSAICSTFSVKAAEKQFPSASDDSILPACNTQRSTVTKGNANATHVRNFPCHKLSGQPALHGDAIAPRRPHRR